MSLRWVRTVLVCWLALSAMATRALAITCPPGHYSVADEPCEPCPPGTFSERGEYCRYCGPGTYQPEYGQTGCRTCAPGSFNPGYGAARCFDCGEGSFAGAGAVQCSACACDDRDPCTADSCASSTGACRHAVLACGADAGHPGDGGADGDDDAGAGEAASDAAVGDAGDGWVKGDGGSAAEPGPSDSPDSRSQLDGAEPRAGCSAAPLNWAGTFASLGVAGLVRLIRRRLRRRV